MDILIRGLERSEIMRIDELAKKAGKTRNVYLRDYITALALAPEIKAVDRDYDRLFNLTIKTIEENTQIVNKLLEVYNV